MKRIYFYKRPLVLLALGICAGIIMGRFILDYRAWLIAAVCLIAALISIYLQFYKLFLALFALSIGLMRILVAYPVLPAPKVNAALLGRVADTPERLENSFRITLDEVSCNDYPIEGRVLLYVPSRTMQFAPQYGQVISASASIDLPSGARNEGGMDMRFYYFSRGISALAYAPFGLKLEQDGKNDFQSHLLSLRTKSSEALIALLGERNGSLASAMIHGDTRYIPEDALRNFRESGIAHLLAVSGLHVSLLAGAILFLLRRAHALIRLISASVFLTLYCLFTALAPSTLRASVMIICFLFANAFSRRNDTLSALSLACIFILLFSPFQLFSVGFQLSFSAVLGLILFSPVIMRAFHKLDQGLSSLFSASLGAQIGTLPFTALYFGRIPIWALFANLLVVPLAGLIVLPSAITLLLYPLSPALASLPAWLAGYMLDLVQAVAAFTSGTFSLASPSFLACLLFFLSLLFLSDFCLAQAKHRYALFALSFLLSIVAWAFPHITKPAKHITMLDVPQGYALHVHTGGEDRIIVSPDAAKSSALLSYLHYHNIDDYTLDMREETVTSLSFEGETIEAGAGYLKLRKQIYLLSVNGQMRITMEAGTPRISAYADDEKYAILIERKPYAVRLEDLWSTAPSLSG